MAKIVWKTEKRRLKDLTELDNNPRTITDLGREQLSEDLDKVGNFRPLVIDNEGVILAGNQRYHSLLSKYGEDYEVEVTVPDKKLTEKERKAVIILDNKHRGEDDVDLLEGEFADILEELGFVDIVESIDSDVEEFEQFETTVEGRKLIIFVFETAEEQKRVMEKLGEKTTNIDGSVLSNLVDRV